MDVKASKANLFEQRVQIRMPKSWTDLRTKVLLHHSVQVEMT